MAKYVDGYVLVIPKDKTDEYKKMAEIGRDIWMKNGALEFYETRGADLSPMEMGDMKTRNFSEMTGAGENDTVWFSFVVFKSKEHRDAVNVKVMAEMDEQMAGQDNATMPFDMRKMAFGSFQVEVEG